MPPVRDSTDLHTRLKAFGRDCVIHGDMTPTAERMLLKILDECQHSLSQCAQDCQCD